MNPGFSRIDPGRVPIPILTMLQTANTQLRAAWTLSERVREIIRLWSASQHACHT